MPLLDGKMVRNGDSSLSCVCVPPAIPDGQLDPFDPGAPHRLLDPYREKRELRFARDSPLAVPGATDSEAPLLVLAKVASTNSSSRFSWPRLCRCRANNLQCFFQPSTADPSLESAMAGLVKRLFRWQVRASARVLRTQNAPFSTALGFVPGFSGGEGGDFSHGNSAEVRISDIILEHSRNEAEKKPNAHTRTPGEVAYLCASAAPD